MVKVLIKIHVPVINKSKLILKNEEHLMIH